MCFSWLFLKIDCDQDSTIKVNTSILNTILTTTEQTVANSGTTNVSQVSFVNLINNGTINCPTFSITSGNVQTTAIINSFTTSQVSDISNQISDKIVNELSTEQEQGLLAFLAANGSQVTSDQLNTQVKNSVTNIVTQSLINNFWANDVQSTSVTLVNNGLLEGDNCKIVAENKLSLRVTNIANSMQTSLQQDAFLNQILTYAKSNQSSGTDLSDITRYLIIGVIVIVVLLVVGAILFAVIL